MIWDEDRLVLKIKREIGLICSLTMKTFDKVLGFMKAFDTVLDCVKTFDTVLDFVKAFDAFLDFMNVFDGKVFEAVADSIHAPKVGPVRPRANK